MKKHILLVEDEHSIADALIFTLEQEGYQTSWKQLGCDALTSIDTDDIDLVILDVGLPDQNGFDVCKAIKQRKDLPIIFLTARQEEVDKVIGLEIGADDYVTKPFSHRELNSRIKILLDRYARMAPAHDGENNQHIQQLDTFTINTEQKSIFYREQMLDLTRYEYLILATMITNPLRVYSRADLMNKIWDEPERSFERSVDTHIKTIRNKLKKIDPQAQPIKTHHGLGYSLSNLAAKP